MMSRVYCLRVSNTLYNCRSLVQGNKLFKGKSEMLTCASQNFSRLSTSAHLPKPRLEQQLIEVLNLRSSDTSNWSIENKARELCGKYLEIPKEERHEFVKCLAMKHSNQERIIAAAEELLGAKEDKQKMEYQNRLKKSLLPPYYWLFTIIGRLENGVKFLVDFRTDVLEILGEPASSDVRSAVQQLNFVLQDLLLLWFSVGFLHLERITWNSPCDLIEKVSKYEAIHPMKNWLDLKHRLGIYRRCYMFTHPAMPGEPLIVLHTALCSQIPEKLQEIDDFISSQKTATCLPFAKEDSSKIDAAVFYSIGATQKGLAGIQLGYYLIKEVVHQVTKEFPSISQFSTLSPVPQFKKWMMKKLKKDVNSIFTKEECQLLQKVLQTQDIVAGLNKLFLNTLWTRNEEICSILRAPLLRESARYLYKEKKGDSTLDKVAHFHLSNGAVLWRINWMAHTSPRHVESSFGIMVNYRYYLKDCETNSHNYIESHFVNASESVQELVEK